MSIKTDLKIHRFVTSEFFTIEYNAMDRWKVCLTGYLLIYKNSTWEFAWDHD